ncbi:MAG: LamG domain-containing protein [Candidatus Brocadiaceae bacterium]|nr:LamG domain-containing protein [Candidatus Brocadiaceae bacterium]
MVAEDATNVPAAIAYQAGINLRLGQGRFQCGQWAGGIDEVRIYSQALSDQEILDLHNDATPTPTPTVTPTPTAAPSPDTDTGRRPQRLRRRRLQRRHRRRLSCRHRHRH